MILRNLSFEEENMAYLASNLLVFRFLMLCIHNKYWTLKQLGLDTFGNLALKVSTNLDRSFCVDSMNLVVFETFDPHRTVSLFRWSWTRSTTRPRSWCWVW